MNSIDSFDLQHLQDEIEPILNQILDNQNLKDVLQKYGVLEAAEIQLKLNTSKLKVQEIEVRRADEAKLKLNIDKFINPEFEVSTYPWCLTCDDFRPSNRCPASPDAC